MERHTEGPWNFLKKKWKAAALDYAWVAIARVLPWLRIQIWELNRGELVPIVRQDFNEGAEGATMDVIYRNGNHYDLLMPKETGVNASQ